MPTNFSIATAAQFSLAAYALADNESTFFGFNTESISGDNAHRQLTASGWRFLDSSDMGSLNSDSASDLDGHYISGNAAAILAVRGDTLVVSFRGTNSSLFNASDQLDWPNRTRHFQLFDALMRDIRSFLEQHTEITRIVATGHSLGASMVDAFISEGSGYPDGRNNLIYEGINFASPGYTVVGSDGGYPNLTTVNIAADVINGGSYLSYLPGDLNRIELLPSAASTFSYHSMDGYLGLMRYLDSFGLSTTFINTFDGRIRVSGYIIELPNPETNSLGAVYFSASSSSRTDYLDAVSPNLFVGGNGNDTIFGSAIGDIIVGGDGNDDIRGGFGVDSIRGSDGDDSLFGGGGDDDLRGESNNDFIAGEANDDIIFGGSGNDFLYGAAGNDYIKGESDDDSIYGGDHEDRLFGDAGADVMYGGSGSDAIDGGDGVDRAVYAGSFTAANYQLTANANGTYTLRSLMNGEGVDTLVRVESLTFGNETKTVEQWITLAGGAPVVNPDPTGGTPYVPTSPEPDTPNGVSNPLLSVTPVNRQLTVGQSVSLIELFPAPFWIDNDGPRDMVRFAVQDRTAGGGYLTHMGQPVAPNQVHEMPISDLGNWRFVAGSGAATDQIGFNIIQADGDFSPRLTTGAVVTTIAAVNPNPSEPDPVVIVGTDVARLDLDSRNGTSGDEGDRAQYTIQRRGNQQGDIVVEWRIVGIGDNPADRRDFSAMSGRVTLYDGRGDRNFAIGISQDQIDEFDERFRIELHVVSGNAVFDDDDATYTIIDDDLPLGIDPNVDDHGNSFATATMVAEDRWARGFIEQPGDQDYFRFDLLGGVGYEFILYKDNDLSVIGGDPNADYPTLPQPITELYNASGQLIATLPATSLSIRWAFEYETPADGTYYLRVRENGDNDVGQYFVQADIRVRADDFAANSSTSAILSAEGSIVGHHERSTDVDWIAVDLVAGDTYRFSLISDNRVVVDGTTGGVGGSNGWYYFGWDRAGFSLLDSAGTVVASRTSGLPTSSNLIEFEAVQSGRFYVAVDGSTGGDMYTYVVNFDRLQERPSTPALVLQPDAAGVVDVRFASTRDSNSAAIDDEILTVNADTSSSIRFDLTGQTATASYAAIEIFLFASGSAITGDIAIDIPLNALNAGSMFGNIGSIEFVTAVQTSGVGQWVTIEITDLYNQWISGERANNGILLSTTEISSALMSFYSSNYSADPSLRPRLVLDGPDIIPTPFGELAGSILEDGVSVDGEIGLTGTSLEFSGAAAAGAWGSISVDSAGDTWTYTLGANAQGLSQGEVVEDLITLTSPTGVSQVIRIEITGQNDQTVVLGAGGFAMAEALSVLRGSSALVDIDADVAPTFTARALLGTFGTFRMTVNGAWSYTLSNAGKLALGTGQAQTEQFSVTATDGTVISFSVNLVGNDNDSLNYATSASAITVDGGRGMDTIIGSSGNDTIYGGTENDSLAGGGGNDLYVVDALGDRVTEAIGGGIDRVAARATYILAAGSEVEFLTTTSAAGTGAINLTGNALSQRIIGNAGANRLEDGLGVADTLTGGAGNDSYVVRNAGTVIVESTGGGTSDAVAASVSFVLAADDNIEVLSTTSFVGTTAINLTGNALSQRIIGNAGANWLEDGLGAADTLTGSTGNDVYVVRNAGTVIVESTGGGTADLVAASVSFVLAADDNIEGLSTTSFAGTSAINLTGNALAQSITGNAGANRIDGLGGSDTLNGGAGADVFVFTTALSVGNVDRIVNYDRATDQIEIDNLVFTGMIDTNTILAASAYTFNTTGLATAGGHRIIYETDTGFLWFDQDGLGGVAAKHFATVSPNIVLGVGEFTVI